jgi:uncharacterized radical SAM superfamily Fe-S cluster-containing enzyme
MQNLKNTLSLCPECLAFLKASIFEDCGKVWIEKTCPSHGKFRELYWGDYEMYKRAASFGKQGKAIQNPATKTEKNCPKDCGLCEQHKGHTALANMVITNRCDLNCWYCFFFAEKAGYVYEPTLEQVKEMVVNLRNEMPVPCNAIQLTGGEPTLREDLLDIIRIIKENGIEHVQLNTDGVNLAIKPELASQVREAGVNTVYLSFDGVTEKTNPKNHWEVPMAMDNCRKAGLGIVLVPTVINSVNDSEVGDILRFGFRNIDIIRAVNFQPVSLVGRMPQKKREQFRITIPDVIKRIETQTAGEISRDDFYPVPTVMPLSRFIEQMTKKPQYELSSHFACGMGTYVFKEGNKMIPIARFLDVPALIEFLNEKAGELENGKSKLWVGAEMLFKFNSFIDKTKAPKEFNFGKILFDVFIKHDYGALGIFHKNSMFIGMMHFMDLYNYDIERVKSCCIHYATPSKEMPIVPFCAFNVVPEWYRDKIQKEFGLPIKEWEQKFGRKLSDDFYKRALYRKTLEEKKQPIGIKVQNSKEIH